LDDILIIGPSFNICLKNMQEALHLLIGAGFIIHEEKSRLVPSTDFPFLGFHWDTVQASLSIPPNEGSKPRSSPT
jgi:predicted transcriptional regulator